MSLIIPFDPANPPFGPLTSARATPSAVSPQTPPPNIPDLQAAIVEGCQMEALDLPIRQALLGHWMKQGDLGYLFAPRGAGKSWMAMLISRAVVTGTSLGEWQAGAAPVPTYYLDAEMNLPDVRARLNSMGLDIPDFFLMSNELLFHAHKHGINIADVSHQQAITRLLPDGCLFVIDNLSTAQLGMAENDNDSFDVLRDWLLHLRHRAITVIIVHHAGRNGHMRGGSRREDMAHWILSLKGDGEGELPHKTSFITELSKCRNCVEAQARPLTWTLDTSTTPLTLTSGSNEPKDVMLQHIYDGIHRSTELAEILGVAQGTVSRWAAKLERLGLITIRNREYHAAG